VSTKKKSHPPVPPDVTGIILRACFGEREDDEAADV
jgi:hypothetical protein